MMRLEPLTPPSKIMASHLARLAYIYVRQSSPKQVERNRESQVYQYQMSERARALGWNTERTRVIDSDLGLSAKTSDHRDGFKALVAEVSLGHVGIIFGYEVSRLARNNADWYHLLDLAAVFGTLIADSDGVYDTRLYNDRLLLGLKGTMSEAELHLLRLRLAAGRMSQVKRGAYRQLLPTGLVRLPDKRVVIDPDAQVRHTIEMVFAKFSELGSCRQVLLYLKRESILLPRRHLTGIHKGQLRWKPPTDASVYAILCNPAYAGAFAYGRRQADAQRQLPGKPASGRLHRPQEEWLHLQQAAYPAYITWEQYLTNHARLQQNSTLFTQTAEGAPGAARNGTALLQGLAVCGLCGYRMGVCYKKSHRYKCEQLVRRVAGEVCQSLHGASIDGAVVAAFFAAIRPANLDALEAVLEAQANERAQLIRGWQERLTRTQYEAHLAGRQYHAVDPDNRLVAAELERRWEAALRDLQQTEEAHERFLRAHAATSLRPELRRQLQHISEELPRLWTSGLLSPAQQKELLRTLVSQVILKRIAADRIEVKIVWVSGHYSVTDTRAPVLCDREVTGYGAMVERIHELWQQGMDQDERVAARLTEEGFHSARTAGVSPKSVLKIRLANAWHYSLQQSRNALELNGRLTPSGVAERVGVGRSWVYRALYCGLISAKYVSRHPHSNVWLVEDDAELIAHLKEALPEKLRNRERHING